jgi:hypothetical protein
VFHCTACLDPIHSTYLTILGTVYFVSIVLYYDQIFDFTSEIFRTTPSYDCTFSLTEKPNVMNGTSIIIFTNHDRT